MRMTLKKCENLEQRRRIRRAIKAIMTRGPSRDASEIRTARSGAGPLRLSSFSSRKNIRRLSLKM